MCVWGGGSPATSVAMATLLRFSGLKVCTIIRKIFPNLSVVAYLVVPAGWGSLPAKAGYFLCFSSLH